MKLLKQAMKINSKQLLFLFIITVTGVYAQNPVVKIDFDQGGRSLSEVNDPAYVSWVVPGADSASKTENGITFTVKRVGPYGNQLRTNWEKAAVQAPYYARLVGDGVTVNNLQTGQNAQIEFRISGLQAGNHTLLMYLNVVDSEAYTYSPIDISIDVNGAPTPMPTLVINDLVPSVRAKKTSDAAYAYLEFTAAASTDVVILFAADTSGSYDFYNVMLNGFELNTPDPANLAKDPIPGHDNEHVELSSAGVLLEWTPADTSPTSHNVYFGADFDLVNDATTSSDEYQGNTVASSYQINNLYTGDTYFWRIDEVFPGGEIQKGSIWRFRPAKLAFPGAEGYGRFARGGRGGKVVAVTNLDDSGPGSLREAVTNDIGPRTIVFNISGRINLNSRLVLNHPYVTVAGQTAPGKGITIARAPFGVTGDDCIVQNVRVRLGGGQTYDGMGMTGGDHSIIDHCSISWTIDEAFSSRGAHNITLQRTLISEALNAAGHQNYPVGTQHGYAASIGGDVGSFHHNLLAHNYGRNWSLAGGLDGNGYYSGLLDITNNVVYNWGSRTTDGGTKELNFVGNYYKPGPGIELTRYALTIDHENVGMGMQRAFFDGNKMPGYFDETNQDYGRRSRDSNNANTTYETFVDTPFFPSYVTTQTADHAYKIVLSDVGCTQPVFDDHDIRMINETLAGTSSVIGSYTSKKGFPDNEADAGGYEDYPEVLRGADWDTDGDGLPNWWEMYASNTSINSGAGDFTDTNDDVNGDGYTNMDYYLQWMSLPHYSTDSGAMISINLQELSRGFESSPTYQISNVVNGATNLAGNVLEFTPTALGLASFDFIVTDSEGDSMTRTVNIVNGVDLALSVDKKVIEDFKIWPIPNNGTFSIRIKGDFDKSEYKIFDILGKEVSHGNIEGGVDNNLKINAKGVFILKIIESKSKQILRTQKIIVQ